MYYRRGPISTYRMWDKPTIKAIHLWYTAMEPIIKSSNLECNILGSSIYDINSASDVDIAYTGKVNDINNLEYLLIMGVDLGFRCNILVDTKWMDNKITVVDNKPNNTEFIFLDYWEYDNGNGTRNIREYKKDNHFKTEGPNTVRGNFIHSKLKQKQLDCIKQHGQLPIMTIEEFLNINKD